MYRSTQTLIPLQTVVIGGYVMDEQDSDGTHYNLPRESDLNFSVVLKALRAINFSSLGQRTTPPPQRKGKTRAAAYPTPS